MSGEIVRIGEKCLICGGEIVKKFGREYDPSSGPPAYEPSFRDQFRKVLKAMYCERCGVMYYHPPNPEVRRQELTSSSS